jgi:hypothetical protein
VIVAVSVAILTLMAPRLARADVQAPQVLDGPSGSILDVDGAAMAADGSGGVVYRKLLHGVPHVFVDQFVNGAWRAPVQVDVGQTGPATMPAVAAGDGGELLVVWVQPWEAQEVNGAVTEVYGLYSAVLDRGARSFGQIERIDAVGDGSAAYPSLSMNAQGEAYVSYRVVTNQLLPGTAQPAGTPTPTRSGDELVDVRVAKFGGTFWSTLGAVNEYPGEVTMRKPTAANAPQIAVGTHGPSNSDAIVVWQEPDATGYARIWARRIFGTTLGPAIQISPDTINSTPVDVDADAPGIAFGHAAEAGFRLAGGSGSPLGTGALYSLAVPQEPADPGTLTFQQLATGSSLGAPAFGAGISGGSTDAFSSGQQVFLADGTAAPKPIGSGVNAGNVLIGADPDGGDLAVWQTNATTGGQAVEVQEHYHGAGSQVGSLSAPVGGPVTGLSLGSSGFGDALLGWAQGPTDGLQVVGSVVQAPPQPFTLSTPSGWVTPAQAKVTWIPAPDAFGHVSYEVVVNGRVLASGLTGASASAPYYDVSAGTNPSAPDSGEADTISYRLATASLGDGTYKVQVIASDQTGQQTASNTESLKVDAQPPEVKLSLNQARDTATVAVSDSTSGVDARDTQISFGDGSKTAKGRDSAVHTYATAGRYVISVQAQDNAGNQRTARLVIEAT